MLTKWLWALFVQLFEFHSRIPFGIQARWGGLIGLWERVREEKKRSLRNLNRRRGHRGGASALCSFRLTRSGRFCLTANDPLGHRFLRSPQSQSSQRASRGRFSPLLVSIDSLASFRLRRQPTGLTFGSLPCSIPNTERRCL